MIRTALSFCLLFAALAAASRWLVDVAPHDQPKAAGQSPPDFEPRWEEAKPLPPASNHAASTGNDQPIQLLAFDEALDEVLFGLKPGSGVKARVDDEELGEEDIATNSTAPIVTPPKE